MAAKILFKVETKKKLGETSLSFLKALKCIAVACLISITKSPSPVYNNDSEPQTTSHTHH